MLYRSSTDRFCWQCFKCYAMIEYESAVQSVFIYISLPWRPHPFLHALRCVVSSRRPRFLSRPVYRSYSDAAGFTSRHQSLSDPQARLSQSLLGLPNPPPPPRSITADTPGCAASANCSTGRVWERPYLTWTAISRWYLGPFRVKWVSRERSEVGCKKNNGLCVTKYHQPKPFELPGMYRWTITATTLINELLNQNWK